MKSPITAIVPFNRLLLWFALLMFPLVAVAADEYKVVLHLSNQHKLHVLVNNVANLRSAFGDRLEIIAVVNGPAVTKFARFSNTEKQIEEILSQGVQLSVCSIAMQNKKILKEQLLDGINYLEEGGVAKLVQLQAKGYAYIKI